MGCHLGPVWPFEVSKAATSAWLTGNGLSLGPVWPFEVSKAATALAELLQTHPPQPHAGIAAWEALMLTYARAHTRAPTPAHTSHTIRAHLPRQESRTRRCVACRSTVRLRW